MGTRTKKTITAPPGGDQSKPVKDATLNVKIDRKTRERFHAACQVLGITIERRIHGYMLETIEQAKIPESN